MEEKPPDRFDPGWNDPPIFTFDKASAIQASANKKGKTLNKRVAYPMTGQSMKTAPVTTIPSLQMNLPPPSSCTLPHSNNSVRNSDSIENLSKTDKLNRVMKNLEVLVPVEDEEIHKRIKMMEKMWIDNKLDIEVQSRLLQLTDALCREDISSADHLQMGLMVDYISQCSSWMSGIRQLINYKRNAKQV